MNENVKDLFQDMINAKDIGAYIDDHKNEIGDISIFYKDRNKQSCFNDFSNYNTGKYYLSGLTDYTDMNFYPRKAEVNGTVYFDINCVAELGRWYKDSEDMEEFTKMLNFIKSNHLNVSLETAMLEEKYNGAEFNNNTLNAFQEFKEADSINSIDRDINFVNLDSQKKEKVNNFENTYYGILALVTKAYLIKLDKEKSDKVTQLVDFSLNELNAILTPELFALSYYLTNDKNLMDYNVTVFHKLQNSRKDKKRTVKNVAWDLFHIRLLEGLVNKIYRDNIINLPFFLTMDRNLITYLKTLDRRVMILEKDGSIVSSFNYNIMKLYDKVCEEATNEKIAYELVDPNMQVIRKINAGFTNYKEISENLLKNLENEG